MKIPITGPAYDIDTPSYQGQKCVNWFLEPDGTADTSPGRYPFILRPTPGITQVQKLNDFKVGRASIVFRDVAYVIVDNAFAQVETTGVLSYIDFLSTSTGSVAMIGGSDGIIMADGVKAYFYSLTTNTFSVIDVSGLIPNPIWAGYLDGYYCLLFANSERVYYSLNATSWDPLGFASANAQADYLTTCLGAYENLWLIGTDTTEIWSLTGQSDAPILRRPGVLIHKGCRAPATVVAMDSVLIWLATDKNGGNIVLAADQSYTVTTISSLAINKQISKYTTITDAYAFSHRVGEHEFYVLTFPTYNKTWVYDTLTKQWHERSSMISVDPTLSSYEPLLKCHRAKAHFYAYGYHWVLDQYTDSISKYDESVYTEYTLPILRWRRTTAQTTDHTTMVMTPRIQDHDNKLHSYYNLVLEMEPGVGLASGQGIDPVVMLQISRDGGHTWEAQDSGHIGALGHYDEPIRWDMLGQARNLVLDFQVTDPVNATIIGATVDVEKNTN